MTQQAVQIAAKHTPGPFTIRDNGYHKNIAGAMFDIMPPTFDPEQPKNKWPFPVASMHKCSPNAKANARLMAAAPDLLEACRDALRTMRVAVEAGLSGFSERKTKEIVENHSTVVMLKQAIAKAINPATGEEKTE